MPESVHGHAVLHMLLDASSPMTREELRQAAGRQFGADARYHTCSAEQMTLDELVAFLVARGKVTDEAGALAAHREEMCAHQ